MITPRGLPYVFDRRGEPAPRWAGDIDYRHALRIMRDLGYEGRVSVESCSGDVIDLQEPSLRWLKAEG